MGLVVQVVRAPARPLSAGSSTYRTELIRRRGRWHTLDHVEIATLERVDWFNTRRLSSALGDTPAEPEATHCHRNTAPRPVGTRGPGGGSGAPRDGALQWCPQRLADEDGVRCGIAR